ncbi:hypothetical protein BJP25_10915 [Actinokineospora bangkokensis]|uniref:histidine kinase n=1 Tax=Actinokineospora bangkokensis TaxID=1193682 RepID=A0A1Q9LRT7_9PSEU|nr:hypothetical protein BJP25_10915 [Actinokineospora bangkokensis]
MTRWRDWGIPVKLGAVILVPVAFAVVLGALRISDQVERADSYRDVDRVVAVTDALRGLLNWVQVERTKSAVLLTGGYGDVGGATAGERQSVQYAREQLGKAVAKADFASPVTRARYADVQTALGRLDQLRGPVAAAQVDSATALARYTEVTAALLDFDRAAAEEVTDEALASTAAALHELDAVQEEVRYQWAQVAVGIARGGLTAADLAALRDSQARLDDHDAAYRAVATDAQRADYERELSIPAARNRADLLRQVLGDGSAPPAPGAALPVSAGDWDVASDLTSGRISAVGSTLGQGLKARSDELQDAAGDAAGIASVVLILALVLAAAVIVLIGRQILRSLAELRRGALEVARTRLPAEVARIRDGGVADPGAVEPIAVPTADEVGQVARAFDAVHEQALRLAGEQAALRAHYGGVFVNLSRRSQGLVQRQLHLLERLERDEEDADQLDTLFQLDHLATRMRRNNENLMVLSGSEPARRSQQPAPLADLLRAAVSEIEQYQRVVIQDPPSVLVVGYAVGDLVRLVAELLDNAAAFSAPTTQVTVTSHHTEGGTVRVEVVDRGIGMRDDELSDANRRLADAGTVDGSTARRMGLFVVGRLAARHGVQVRLRAGNQSGTRATVVIPADLVTANVADLKPATPRRTAPEGAARVNGHGTRANGTANGAVNGSVNGTANGSVNGATKGSVNGAANGSRVNGSGVNGAHRSPAGPPTTSSGLPRRTPAGGDGATLPEQVPTPRESDARGDQQQPPAADKPAAPEPKATGWSSVRPPLPDRPAGEQVPLPRREPRSTRRGDAQRGAGQQGRGREGAGRPGGQRAEATGEHLFAPSPAEQTGWWDTTPERAPGAPPAAALQETTPIFDEMISAWFRAVTDDPASSADDVRTPPTGSWDFAADQGFSTAQAVADTAPEDFTGTGLPRRTPRRNLVPGSIDRPSSEVPPGAPIGSRNAAELRQRLSSYQRGVHRARGAHHAGPAHAAPEPAGPDLTGAGFRISADTPPAEVADTGLPRRTPRQRLLPGSLDPAPAPAPGPVMERDAAALRTRLGSLQRGIGRGRESLSRRPEPAQDPDRGWG